MGAAVFSGITNLAIFGLLLLVFRPYAPVTRARLERFAGRQRLVITPANGSRVIAYLRTTRRWRATGALAGLGCSVVLDIAHGRSLHFGGEEAFVGWFIGAVLAEWRIGSSARNGARRAASLSPRRLSDYVPMGMRGLSAAALVLVLVLGMGLFIATPVAVPTMIIAAAVTTTVVAVIAVVARQVLSRPQSPEAADVMAADDALRSRSLQVLLGSGVVLVGAVLAVLATAAGRELPDYHYSQWVSAAKLVGVIALPLLGWGMATSGFDAAARRRVSAPA